MDGNEQIISSIYKDIYVRNNDEYVVEINIPSDEYNYIHNIFILFTIIQIISANLE